MANETRTDSLNRINTHEGDKPPWSSENPNTTTKEDSC